MMTEKAQRKRKALLFWQKYGLAATMEAFDVKRRTLFYWKAQQRQSAGKLEGLNERSRAPVKKRKRVWPRRPIVQEIRRLRSVHKNLGKEKLYPFVKRYCQDHGLVCPSARTIGRLIADTSDKMRTIPTKINARGRRIPRKKQKRDHKPKGFRAQFPGHCLAFDSIEKFIDGYRRYIITCVDLYSRFSFSWATNSHASLAGSQFFRLVLTVFPHKIHHVLTDNGSEFKRHFTEALRETCHSHWHTYPDKGLLF